MKASLRLIFITLLIGLIIPNLKSQNLFEINGFSVQCFYAMDETDTAEYNQVFNFSNSDKLMIHNVFTDEMEVNDSQIYKVIKKESGMKEGVPVYKYAVKSGLSGIIYYYSIYVSSEMCVVTHNDISWDYEENQVLYVGYLTHLKTYKGDK